MFCLLLCWQILFAQAIFCCEFSNYEDFTSVYMAPYVSEGTGDILVSSRRILTSGTTAVEANVPVTGSVNFNGPVRAAGTVSIFAACQPPRVTQLSSIPSIGTRNVPQIPITRTIIRRTILSPITVTRAYPTTLSNLPVVSIPDTLPTVSLPVTEVVPEVSVPVDNITGFGKVSVSTPMMGVSGTAVVDGVVPVTGEVKFNGIVPGKGTVHIACTCRY